MAKKGSASTAIGATANLDTPMEQPITKRHDVGSLSQNPGKYNEHPALGPKGPDGGMPILFFDENIKTEIGPVDSVGMTVTPMKRGRV